MLNNINEKKSAFGFVCFYYYFKMKTFLTHCVPVTTKKYGGKAWKMQYKSMFSFSPFWIFSFPLSCL